MRRRFAHAAWVGGCLVLAACSLLPTAGGPAPLEIPATVAAPVAEVTFSLTVAAPSPPGTGVSVELVDEVSGLDPSVVEVPLSLQADGSWTGRVTPPVGSILRYRYHRSAPSPADEATVNGDATHYRLAVVSGSMTVSDVLAAWADLPYVGTSGRIIGTITETGTGAPLVDMLVTAGGLAAFTDGQGDFRLDGLPPGLHTLAVLSPLGDHHPVQQGAIVAADSATPAALSLEPAPAIQVSFEVTVPADTPPGSVLRLLGDTRILGDTFSVLPGGQSIDVTQALPLVMVDSTHYLALATLHAGEDLHYKYSLGDGTWNAERDAQGSLWTRQLILPNEDLVVADVVSTWHAPQGGSVPFFATAPAGTPASDVLSLELSNGSWTSPLPMWPLGNGQWTYTLLAPTADAAALHYRFCRNQQCDRADDVDTAGPQAVGRPLNPASPPSDVISAWSWWDPSAGGATVVAPEIVARPDFETGYEILAPFAPTWTSALPAAFAEMVAGGANSVVLTPSWSLGSAASIPRVAFDPAQSPFVSDLVRQADQARLAGLQVSLRPRLIPDGNLPTWWEESARDSAWWTVWFESYRSFALEYAQVAEQAAAAKLVLGGAEVVPALPGGRLANGSPSGVPADSEQRWRGLLSEVRAIYHGRLAWELDFGATLQRIPTFLDAVDDVHVAWHAPLGQGTELTPDAMQTEAYRLLDSVLLTERALQGRPLVLSVEYLSINGGATGCAPSPDGSCRSSSEFDSGAVVDPDLSVDLAEQSAAINGVLLAAYGRDSIHGFYVDGFHPAVALQDKSTSVRGKPAQQMLGYWYPRLTGR